MMRKSNRKGDVTLMFLVLVIAVVLAVVLVGEFVGNYFSFVYKVINIKGQVNVFMVNDDAGTQVVSLLNAKSSGVKNIELLGMYATDGLSENKKRYIDPIETTMNGVYKSYSFSFDGPRPVSFQQGVPTQIQDSSRSAILGCGVSTKDSINLRWPSSSMTISSGFGGRELKKGVCDCHGGIDIGGENEDVYAAAGGIVVDVYKTCAVGEMKCNNGYGNWIVIEHKIGMNTYRTYYDHLKEVYVNRNDEVGYEDPKVSSPKAIGKTGNTGYSTGSHLHFEIRVSPYTPDKNSINPCGLFKDMPSVTVKCNHDPVNVCKYVSGMISGSSVRNYATEVPLPGPSADNPNLRGTVTFKQWD